MALAALFIFGNRQPVRAAEGDQVEYTFGRPVGKGERTYDWYRKTHADEAAKRYGVDPEAVGDGMDTWHWWTGIDNPGFWRQLTILTTGKLKPLDVRIDLLRTLMLPRSQRSAPQSFYRTPTLVSIWATAPYLHNNSVGVYTGDPSVAGRMTAYQDGMTKLLWPELRPGIRSVKVTTEDSKLPDLFPMLKEQLPEFADLPDLELGSLRVPKGTPINLLMNVHPKDIKICSASVRRRGFAGRAEDKVRRASDQEPRRGAPANDG